MGSNPTLVRLKILFLFPLANLFLGLVSYWLYIIEILVTFLKPLQSEFRVKTPVFVILTEFI